jgi:predicted 2-oxoglutarate/Fe(II)-dependent dioxygenase YbiX
MHTTSRDRLVHLLAGDPTTRSDAAMLHLPADALSLHVADVGRVALPMRAAQAKRMIAVARPAQFGRGEETLSDTSVRDTWELTSDQVTLDGADWEAHLTAALAHFRDELGLPPSSVLRAELHSLLVYGRGQFFRAHQDSEKHDDMVATLVVSLPSVHSGGELVVDDGGTERTFFSSRNELVLVAFYTDRRHEVKPVRSGYRVTLTFNLLLTGPTQTCDAGPVELAAHHLTEHFTTRAPLGCDGDDLGEPTRLAFLLDHEYTQAGLRSGLFKGADFERVSVLREAAERAGCEIVFALAEIKETHNAHPAGEPWRYEGYSDECQTQRDKSEVVNDYPLKVSGVDGLTLGWWVDADGSGGETINLPLAHHEVCAVTPSRSLTPYNSEYQGYMGNEGNTVERWYRRAAVVMWPKEQSFASRAEAAPAWALGTLRHRIDVGDLEGAQSDAASLAPFWRCIDEDALQPALDVALDLRDPHAAGVVLAPFGLEMLTADHAASLAALAREYGNTWVNDLVDGWDSARRFPGVSRTNWVVDTLLPLSRALRGRDAAAVADHVGDLVWRSLLNHIYAWLYLDDPDSRCLHLSKLGQPLARLLEAVSDRSGARITAGLHARDDNILELLVPTLRAHRPPSRTAFAAIAQDVSDRLTRLVDAPSQTADDWSINWTGCGCELCLRLETFLASQSERTHEWPLATTGREHVHRQIDASGLPVQLTTQRQGRPFTLVLEKTWSVVQQDHDTRQEAHHHLEWVANDYL